MSDRFDIRALPLAGMHLLQRVPRRDERGWFERVYDTGELVDVLGTRTIAQVNRTFTNRKASVRGMHFQISPSADAKVVSCTLGAIFDVAVDLRRDSPTFLQWQAEELTQDNRRSLFVPEGFAHGFQTLVDECEVLYLHTAPYDAPSERGVHPTDRRLAIAWPMAIDNLSARDASWPAMGADFEGIVT